MLVSDTFTLNSSIDETFGMVSKYTYDDSLTNLPVVVLMHGFNLTIDAITQEIMERIANEGYFVLAAGMRGRNGASGSKDASGREVFDIYDAVNYVKSTFPVSDKIAISGYSGGGGNALAAAVKFPDTFNVVVSHFGMSDYGYDETYGWYYTNPSYADNIASFVNARPDEAPNKYLSRAHINGMTNFEGKLFAFHDAEDTQVDVLQTQRLQTVLSATNVDGEYYYTTSSDSVRYLHDMNVSAITEPSWLPVVKTQPSAEVSDTGTVNVLGYLVTKKFKIILEGYDANAAEVTYDLNTNTFIIDPLSGALNVRIQHGELSNIYHVEGLTELVLSQGEMVGNGQIKHAFVKDGNMLRQVKATYLNKNGAIRRMQL